MSDSIQRVDIAEIRAMLPAFPTTDGGMWKQQVGGLLDEVERLQDNLALIGAHCATQRPSLELIARICAAGFQWKHDDAASALVRVLAGRSTQWVTPT